MGQSQKKQSISSPFPQGTAKFTESVTLSTPSLYYLKNLNTNEWKINGEYLTVEQKEVYAYCFQNMISSSVRYIQVQRYQLSYPNSIIKQISSIRFDYLRDLYLNKNNIQSIEQIARINFANLQLLNLNKNYIVSLKPLRKCNFHKLKAISILQNQMNSILCLTQANLSDIMDFIEISQQNQPKQTKMRINFYISDQLSTMMKSKPLSLQRWSRHKRNTIFVQLQHQFIKLKGIEQMKRQRELQHDISQ